MSRIANLSANASAFLDTIAWSEIGPELLAITDDGYNVLVGSTPERPLIFPSYAEHPNTLNRELDSTAAGRYQILFREWKVYAVTLKLPDFGPVVQDKIALQMISECHARASIEAGNIQFAVVLCSSRWASFPGSTAGQHQQKIADLTAAFTAAGGTLATP